MKRQKDRTLKDELPRSVDAQYATGDQWRNNSKKNEEMELKQEHSVVDVTGDGSRAWCYKEQYCIEIWQVRSMNQGKLEVFKQEMARVNVDILGISGLRWNGMGEFNSDDHYIYYCWQEYWSGLPFSSPVDHVLSDLCTMTRPSWVALHSLAHNFIELDKAVVHVISLISFLWL